ncbi:hypothetical protein D2V17_10500 [Aurantiacibacter xanthus]|uniref:Uncharacterized protein n=1 Tax=Aurantiacibacter xanthus TaxID=1784712 RepID=A0A3A1P8A4_9SPHN|nr:hypothetical protein [Aurantiacibacter xanthus]RIV85512.1 hypothetical protein D2V17_10500 [Aurantiacibacter xanthus]
MTQMPKLHAAMIAAAMLAMPAAHAQETQEASAEVQAKGYSVGTTQVAVLLDDPKAAAILERLIPTVYANDLFQTMGRSQTLAAIQQYEPAALTDAKLAEIQAEFDRLATEG